MNRIRWHWDIGLFILLMIVFLATPKLDLMFSGLFYQPDQGFFLRNEPWVLFIHQFIPAVARVLSAILAIVLVLSLVPRFTKLSQLRRPTLFLLLSFGLGPGLLVNGVFKDHWGRARPADVQAFGGSKAFTPAFIMTDQCSRNCSFVSGHAAQGFFFSLFGFLARRRLWFAPGLAFGGLVGLARIVQGRHFLSDVVFALFAVYFVGKLVYKVLYPRTCTTQDQPNSAEAGGLLLRLGHRLGLPATILSSLAPRND